VLRGSSKGCRLGHRRDRWATGTPHIVIPAVAKRGSGMDFWFRRNAVEPVSGINSSRSKVFFNLLMVREAVQLRIEFTRL
jgi:hypothetical protein